MTRLAFPMFAIAALCCTAIGGAQAFTYDGRASLNMDTSLRYQDPDDKFQNNLTSPPGTNSSSGKFGNFSFKFSSSNSSGPAGIEDRFVPSGNSAFASPFGQNNLDLALGNRH